MLQRAPAQRRSLAARVRAAALHHRRGLIAWARSTFQTADGSHHAETTTAATGLVAKSVIVLLVDELGTLSSRGRDCGSRGPIGGVVGRNVPGAPMGQRSRPPRACGLGQ